MVVLDNTADFPNEKVPVRFPKLSLPAWVAIAAGVVVFGSLAIRGFSDNGFRLASQNAWRFACLVFFAAIVAGPLGRLVPGARRLEESSCQIFRAFCATYGVYLATILIPNAFGAYGIAHGLPLGTTVFLMFGTCVTLVMAMALSPRMTERAGVGVRRALLGVSALYFWLCYTLMGLAHISHPHRPDGFYGFSVCLMLVALLIRFGDSFKTKLQGAPRAA